MTREEWVAAKFSYVVWQEGEEWYAFEPRCGAAGTTGCGPTPSDAIEMAERFRIGLWDECIRLRGTPSLPVPVDEDDDDHFGRLPQTILDAIVEWGQVQAVREAGP